MKKQRLTVIGALFIAGTIGLMVSCNDYNALDIQESLDVIPNVTLVDGAENATIRVERGADSYFNVNISNIEWNNLVSEGKREAWCLSWKDPISSDNTPYEGIGVYSTKGDKSFASVNRLFTIKPQLMRNDPDITYREIQIAIWSLLDHPKFDMHDTERLPSRFKTNGQPNFDKAKVENIIQAVKSSGPSMQRSLSGGLASERSICILATDPDTQTIAVVCDETAYAYGGELSSTSTDPAGDVGDGYAVCFPNVEDATEEKWGWTNGDLSPGNYEWPIYAGAGQCILSKGSIVGTLYVNFSNNGGGNYSAEVTYDLDTEAFDIEGFDFVELLHLYVGDTAIPPSGNFAPGHFYKDGDPDYFPQELISQDNVNLTATYKITGLPNRIWVIGHIGG